MAATALATSFLIGAIKILRDLALRPQSTPGRLVAQHTIHTHRLSELSLSALRSGGAHVPCIFGGVCMAVGTLAERALRGSHAGLQGSPKVQAGAVTCLSGHPAVHRLLQHGDEPPCRCIGMDQVRCHVREP